MPSRAAMKRFSANSSVLSTRSGEAKPSVASRRAMHCTSATSAAVSVTVVWASMTRTSTVPKRGTGRTSHHR